MAKSRFIQNSFSSGILSPLLRGRLDINQYYQGLSTCDNFVLIPQGGVKRRPGTAYTDKGLNKLSRSTTLPAMPRGGVPADINDGDESSSTSTTFPIGTVDPYIAAEYDLGSSQFVLFVDVRNIFLTTFSSSEFFVQYSDDGIAYTNIGQLSLGVNATDYRFFAGLSAQYWRLARIGSTNLGADVVTLGEFNLLTESGALSACYLKDFSIRSDLHYLLSFTEGNCRVYRDGSRVADIKTVYTESQLATLRDNQSESVMLLFQEDVITKRLINLGSDDQWLLDDAPYINIPQFDYNDDQSPNPVAEIQVATFASFVAGDQYQIDVEGVLSKNITYAGDANATEQSSTAENLRKNLQDMPVFGDTGISVVRSGAAAYTITITGESTKAFELFSGFATTGTASKTISFAQNQQGSPRSEDVFSSVRGYPKTGCFYQGRLVLGGTKSKPQSIIMSKAGSAFNLDTGEGDDDEAIFITISSRKLNNIVDVFPGRNLQIFTDGSEFSVNQTPITPSNVDVSPQTSHGAINIEVADIDGATLFADRNGKSIKSYLFTFQEDSYTTNDISVLSPELISNPVNLSILGGDAADDANWLFIINDDGNATVLNTLREQDINGFTRWITSGELTNSVVLDKDLYMVNKRTIGGVENYFIEQWSFEHLMDNSVKRSPVGSQITDLDYLDGQTVQVVADGIVLPERTVSSGVIELDSSEIGYFNFEVGINFTPSLSSMPINSNPGSGQNQMRLKKIIRMNARVQNTSGLYIEGIPVPVRQFGDSSDSPLNSPPNVESGIIDDIFSLIGWDRYNSMPQFTLPDPTPCTLLAIEYEVESS